jgi:hypothetical protein
VIRLSANETIRDFNISATDELTKQLQPLGERAQGLKSEGLPSSLIHSA